MIFMFEKTRKLFRNKEYYSVDRVDKFLNENNC